VLRSGGARDPAPLAAVAHARKERPHAATRRGLLPSRKPPSHFPEEVAMSLSRSARAALVPAAAALFCAAMGAAQEPPPRKSSYMPVVPKESFTAVMRRMTAEKAAVMERQKALLADRYDLGNRPAAGVTMFRGKAVQDGVRAKLPAGVTWDALAAMTPDQVRERGAF